MMTIGEAPLNTKLTVRSFRVDEVRDFSEVESRLMLLGFLSGSVVVVVKKAPFFNDPILVDVRGRMIALSRDEAMLINVEISP